MDKCLYEGGNREEMIRDAWAATREISVIR